jgi:hypothetical protein
MIAYLQHLACRRLDGARKRRAEHERLPIRSYVAHNALDLRLHAHTVCHDTQSRSTLT